MNREALRVIRDEHASVAAMLQSLLQMIERGPEPQGKDQHELYFDVLRAMLFYIDEFPEKLHHPKESDLLFPRVARAAPQVMATIEQLERDHLAGESQVRELMHLLMAWEYLGETRRDAFETGPGDTSRSIWSTCGWRSGWCCLRRSSGSKRATGMR